MDIYDLSKKECRTILLKKFSKHKKAQRDNWMKLGKKIHEQNEKFNKEKETTKKQEENKTKTQKFFSRIQWLNWRIKYRTLTVDLTK